MRPTGSEAAPGGFDALRPVSASLDGQVFSWGEYETLRLPLLGEHQLKNAAVVLTGVQVLREKGWRISDEAVRRGLAQTRWPARFEVLGREPLFIVDGAHNPQCAEALGEMLKTYLPGRRLCFLAGVLADKDYGAMLEQVLPFARRFICLTPDSPRALPAEKLCALVESRGVPACACGDIRQGVQLCLDDGGDTVSFGSLYMAGYVREAYKSLTQR